MSKKSRDPNFPGMQPIPRLHRPVIITEKINGTNGLIAVAERKLLNGAPELDHPSFMWPEPLATFGILDESNAEGWKTYGIWAGSKNQWLGPDGDNFGFGAWVRENHAQLIQTLGEGLHRGEWWGSGIQVGYGLPKGEKRFSLFNTSRWIMRSQLWANYTAEVLEDGVVPGLGVVPVLEQDVPGRDLNEKVLDWLGHLQVDGSRAAPGFMRPEGVVIYQPSSQITFKATIENDEIPKSLARNG